MPAPDFCSLQKIREGAGLQHKVVGEEPTGLVNGSNVYFYVERLYIVDRDYDDTLEVTDVTFYDDGTAVTVSAVDPVTGKITLASAPASDSVLKVNYDFCVASDTAVDEFREEAQDIIRNKVLGRIDYDNLTSETFPKVFRTITNLLASGYMLIRDYGASADTDLSSKDGYEKIKLGMKMLKEYMDDTEDNSTTTSETSATTNTDGNIFHRNTDLDNSLLENTTDDDEFFHKDN